MTNNLHKREFYNLESEETIEHLEGFVWKFTDKDGKSESLEFELDSESDDFVLLFTRIKICENGNIKLFRHGQWKEYVKIKK